MDDIRASYRYYMAGARGAGSNVFLTGVLWAMEVGALRRSNSAQLKQKARKTLQLIEYGTVMLHLSPLGL